MRPKFLIARVEGKSIRAFLYEHDEPLQFDDYAQAQKHGFPKSFEIVRVEFLKESQ